jgi:hypothetical protein
MSADADANRTNDAVAIAHAEQLPGKIDIQADPRSAKAEAATRNPADMSVRHVRGDYAKTRARGASNGQRLRGAELGAGRDPREHSAMWTVAQDDLTANVCDQHSRPRFRVYSADGGDRRPDSIRARGALRMQCENADEVCADGEGSGKGDAAGHSAEIGTSAAGLNICRAMKRLAGIMLLAYVAVGCGSSHQAATRLKIEVGDGSGVHAYRLECGPPMARHRSRPESVRGSSRRRTSSSAGRGSLIRAPGRSTR